MTIRFVLIIYFTCFFNFQCLIFIKYDQHCLIKMCKRKVAVPQGLFTLNPINPHKQTSGIFSLRMTFVTTIIDYLSFFIYHLFLWRFIYRYLFVTTVLITVADWEISCLFRTYLLIIINIVLGIAFAVRLWEKLVYRYVTKVIDLLM